MSGGDIDILLNLIAATLTRHNDQLLFRNHKEMYETIDVTTHGGAPWKSFALHYNGERPDCPAPSWMEVEFDVWYRDPRKLIHQLISNTEFKGEFNYVPFHEYVNGKHCFHNFMSGDWAWKQAVSNLFSTLFSCSKHNIG